MKIRILLDEHITPRVKGALIRLDRQIDVLRIGDYGVPELEIDDVSILRFVEQSNQIFVTQDYQTIPVHAANHLKDGGHHWGIFLVRPHVSIGELAESLYEAWVCLEAEELIDTIEWIPF